ncbi:type 1 fimbria pilin [Acinetobacter calcoaceticus]|uniref:Type 1 fimbria pilin n=1 Tax=Acinetobacter calcoaceticus TaxID=471 RepID=A0A4R1Y0R3_ACICA|nr:type 1 fimbria pilin [Acinetobacter calcoaceticus]
MNDLKRRTAHRSKRCCLYLSGLLLTTAITTAHAAAELSSQSTLTIRVEVSDPTCTINNNAKQISVNFGDDVLTTDIDGKNYMRDILYSLQCDSGVNNSMRLRMVGNQGFNADYLYTNKPGLGIVFYLGNEQLKLNQWANIRSSALPTLKAAPIRQPEVRLSGGGFIANATLYIDYQ